METQQGNQAERLGRQLRAVRQSQALTLVEVAGRSGLSHSFLSQLERGMAQPSLSSLERIARALGTSQLELMAEASDRGRGSVPTPSVVRAGEGERGAYGLGEATLLVRGDRHFRPMLFNGANAATGGYHEHREDEFVHVISGQCTVDLDRLGQHVLGPGDSLYYPGGTPHRWFSPAAEPYQLFVVKDHPPAQPLTPSLDGLSP